MSFVRTFSLVMLGLLSTGHCRKEPREQEGGPDNSTHIRQAIVRIETQRASATGFFVRVPAADNAQEVQPRLVVVTAAHVLADGYPVTVQREIDVGEDQVFVESYEQVDVVAFDPDQDLALLEIRNFPVSRVEPLALGEPKKDERIYSWGFPASELVTQRRLGLTRKEGTISNFRNLPVYDRRTGKLLKDNATKGIIISSALEPGFSGGPTVNAKGEVVGINARKDPRYEAQNAAIHVSLLQGMLSSLRPPLPPSESEIAELLNEVYMHYFTYTPDGVENIREEDFVALSEVPLIAKYVRLLREVQKATQSSREARLSAAALVGIILFNLPGKTFDAFLSKDYFSECEEQLRKVERFFRSFGVEKFSEIDEAIERCAEQGVRPLMWDLMAATLRWDGSRAPYRVSRVEEVDAERRLYAATVTKEGVAPFKVLVGRDYGHLRVRLFDPREMGRLYVLNELATITAAPLAGKWYSRTLRAPLPETGGADSESEENLDVTVDSDGTVRAIHRVTVTVYAPPGKYFYKCGSSRATTNAVQRFSGRLENGILIMKPEAAMEVSGNAGWCLGQHRYSQDLLVTLKRFGNRLIMYRTDGKQFPESKEFERL